MFKFIGPAVVLISISSMVSVYGTNCVISASVNLEARQDQNRVIFNTDLMEEGSHWISLFINMRAKKPYIYFFDRTEIRSRRRFGSS